MTFQGNYSFVKKLRKLTKYSWIFLKIFYTIFLLGYKGYYFSYMCPMLIMQTWHFSSFFCHSLYLFFLSSSFLCSIYLSHSSTHTFITTEGPTDLAAAFRRLLNQWASVLLLLTAMASLHFSEPALPDRHARTTEATMSCTCFIPGRMTWQKTAGSHECNCSTYVAVH